LPKSAHHPENVGLGGGLIANAIELALHRSYRHTQQSANSDG
jgi:hypothetical protein